MAIKDTARKPYIEDNDDNIFIGLDLPIHKSSGPEGYFASTSTTIEAVKNNIRNLLNTERGERLMQPQFGINLKKFLFEPMSEESIVSIQDEILDTFQIWLPFVEIRDIQVNSSKVGLNSLNLNIVFNIKQDPNTLDSVQIQITEEVDQIETANSTAVGTSGAGGGGY